MKTIKIKTTGLSILELKKKYPKLFYDQSWYDDEPFAKEKPEAGEFEIVTEETLLRKTFSEQMNALKTDEIILHPAQYVEGMINHFNETGIRMFEDWFTRTNTLDSDGHRVGVGYFDSGGLSVSDCCDDYRYDSLGLSTAIGGSPRTLEPLKPRLY